tara:strand:- start:891 stop:3020 length:2130 start_codon:yes stop_codon:yes gene_type:complete
MLKFFFNSSTISIFAKKNMYRLLLFVLIPFLSISQNWNQVANFSGDGRHHPITFANDDYGFVVCGSYLNNMFKYDKLNDTWTQLQDFPSSGRGYAYGVTNGDKAYMGFGSTSNGAYPTDWWEYNMNNDSWVQKASFPGDGRNHPAMIVVNNKIYMGCGSNGSGNLGDWWEYDIILDSWSQKSDIIGNDRHHPYYFGIGDYAYVGFGHGSLPGPGSNPSSNSYIYNDFYRYDPSNDSWLQLNDFPSEARVAGTQLSYNGKGYVLSGDGDDHGPLSSGEFWEYSPSNDSWNQLPSHPGGAIWAPGNFVIGCDVYFLLGQDWNSNIPTDPISVYKYKLSEDCGCTDTLAVNFSNLATIDDGSCCYVSGCMDPLALNYNASACIDDGSCVAPVLGCTDTSASNYDASANTTIASGGAIDNTFGSGGFFNGDQHLNFDAYKECIIRSATIYSEASNTINFELRNSNGVVIDDTTLTVSSGQQIVDLNFEVPIGNDMQIGVAQGALQNVGLYRNNASASYPYDIGSAINITSSSASTAPNSYYYFYYDIEVETPCQGSPSPSWDCDGQGSCNDPGTGNGQYTSLAACQSNCIVPSWDCDGNSCFDPGNGLGQYNSLVDCEANCVNVSIEEFGLINFKVYPNPSNGIFNIEFISKVRQDLNIRVVNMVGESTLIENLDQFSGKFSQSINLKNKSIGVYFLEITTKENVFRKMIVID